MTCFTLYHSPIGPLRLTSDGAALTGLWMGLQNPDLTNAQRREDLAIFDSVKHWLDDYFAGNPREITFPSPLWERPFSAGYGSFC